MVIRQSALFCLLLVFLCLCLGAPPPAHAQAAAPTPPAKPTLYVLSFGVSQYQDPTNSLQFPAKDAQDVADAFRAQEGRVFGRVVVTILTDRKATRADVIHALLSLHKEGKEMKPGDCAVVFMAGQGTYDDLGQHFFAPYDADTAEVEVSCVQWQALIEPLIALPCRAILMLETSHSASAVMPLSATSHSGAQVSALALCGKDELSQESAGWNNGAFAKALVEGLGGKADADHNGIVTVTELGKYVGARVAELTKGAQHPVFVSPPSVPADLPLAQIP